MHSADGGAMSDGLLEKTSCPHCLNLILFRDSPEEGTVVKCGCCGRKSAVTSITIDCTSFLDRGERRIEHLKELRLLPPEDLD